MVLLPVGLMGLGRQDAWVLGGMVPCYIAGYAFFAFLRQGAIEPTRSVRLAGSVRRKPARPDTRSPTGIRARTAL